MKRPAAVGLGEALFDRFGSVEVLGGAPANFAVHLAALLAPIGGSAAVLSRVGSDDRGQRLRAELKRRGVVTTYVQVDATLPTGVVNVSVDARGEPTYDIARPVAWDAIKVTSQARALLSSVDAVVFGTLAQREPAGRSSTRSLLRTCTAPIRLFDANLRPGFEDNGRLSESLSLATHLKVNEHELPRVAESVGVLQSERRAACVAIIDAFALDGIVLTRGERGTEYHTADERVVPDPPIASRDPDADAVGAGDACAAGIVAGLLVGLTLEETVTLANELGAFVASRRGAAPELPSTILNRLA